MLWRAAPGQCEFTLRGRRSGVSRHFQDLYAAVTLYGSSVDFPLRVIYLHVLRNAANCFADRQSRRLLARLSADSKSASVSQRSRTLKFSWFAGVSLCDSRFTPNTEKFSKRDTWLILPVVICLSQRLSHACPSTSLIKVKPRMAH